MGEERDGRGGRKEGEMGEEREMGDEREMGGGDGSPGMSSNRAGGESRRCTKGGGFSMGREKQW